MSRMLSELGPIRSARLAAVEIVLTLLIVVLLDQLHSPKKLRPAQTLWDIYSLLRSVKNPSRHRKLFATLIKDLPHELQVELVREVSGLSDAGSVLLRALLAAQSQDVVEDSSLHLGLAGPE
jgi:hypothetical protein